MPTGGVRERPILCPGLAALAPSEHLACLLRPLCREHQPTGGDLFWLDAHALDRAPDVVEKALLEAGIAGDDARMSADALAWRCDMLGGLLG